MSRTVRILNRDGDIGTVTLKTHWNGTTSEIEQGAYIAYDNGEGRNVLFGMDMFEVDHLFRENDGNIKVVRKDGATEIVVLTNPLPADPPAPDSPSPSPGR